MKLNNFKRKALCQEFPFLAGKELSALLDKAEELTIKKIDSQLLNSVPQHYARDGSVVGISRGWDVNFVLTDGSVITDAVCQDGEEGSNYAHSDTCYRTGETVLHAIDRHGVEVNFIVVRHYGIHTEDHYSFGSRLTVFKPAKGIEISELVEAAYEAASIEVAAESNF